MVKAKNLKVGDIVLLWNDRTARNDWKIARMTSVKLGSDGLVRSAKVILENSRLDKLGKAMEPATKLTRTVNKLIQPLEA